jgi:glycosyltransferase involved in cell wall biosynthesis
MSPIASVIVAAHDAAPYVGEAIASALAQTLQEIEVVVVDDGSADGTWEAISVLARRDSRVVPLRLPHRSGAPAARNAALARATGRWLAVLDADDLFLPERLARLVALAEAAGADLLADNLLERDFASGADLGRHFPDAAMAHAGPLPLTELVRRNMTDMPGRARIGYAKPILRREFLLGHGLRYEEEVLSGHDFLLYFECVARGGRFHLTPEAHYVYQVREGSLSAQRTSILYHSLANRRMLRLAASLGEREAKALLRRRQRLIDFYCFALAAERGEVRAALNYAHLGGVGPMLRQTRVAAGAARRRLAARAAAAWEWAKARQTW